MKARKILSLALALVLCLGLLPTTSLAAGDFKITDGILVEYTGPGGDVVIPQGVTAIGKDAFENCKNLTSVTIPDGVTSIGNYAFARCTSLTNVVIPYGVTSIGESAFQQCTSLTSVVIPYGVTAINKDVFSLCTSLTNVIIPDSVTTIGWCSFYRCNSLTSITIPDRMTYIGQSAFESCGNLTSVTLGNGLTRIGYSAFGSCYGLTSIVIPDSVTTISENAFSYCTNLANITLGKGLIEMGGDAFFNCPRTSVTIPPEVEAIEALKLPADAEVHGAPGSYAELYAQDRRCKFIADRPFTTTPSRTAYPSTQNVNIDGKLVEFQMYALKDEVGNLTNYIKLRDLAYALNGTQAQFEVGYDNNTVSVTSNTPYTANGSEMKTPFSGNRTYLDDSGKLRLNGYGKNVHHFTLRDDNGGGYTYYKLRDIGQLLGFNVGWNASKGVFVETDKPYDPSN